MNTQRPSQTVRSRPGRSIPCVAACALAVTAGCSQAHAFSPRGDRDAVRTGAFVGDGDYARGYARHARTTGRPPGLLLNFTPWAQRGTLPFPEDFCLFAIERAVIPIITWEPWEPWSGWYPRLADIAAGAEDERIGQWAARARQLPGTVLLRFAHEMNGDWYPWSVRKDPAQRPEDYVAAWRRIHELFEQQRADNVQFIWCPNFEPVDNIAFYYPGDDVVDWVGLDVYNHPEWPRPPGPLIDPVYRFAVQRDKPVLLTEVGSAEKFEPVRGTGSLDPWRSKSRWIEALFREVAARPDIHGLVWFDVHKESDWRIHSSVSAWTAFRHGLVLLETLDNQQD